MIGTLVNVAAIVVGGAAGSSVRRDLPSRQQRFFQYLVGGLILYLGFRSVWVNVGGTLMSVILQVTAALVALVIGNWLGKWAGLQRQVNRLGRYARERYQEARKSGGGGSLGDGFVSCSILFCVGPLAAVGALQDGFQHDPRTLLVKALMDGLAAIGFGRIFGLGVILSALPVLAYQGSLTLLATWARPWVARPDLLEGFGVVGGLLVAMTALVALDVRKVPLADYLPALLIGPLLRMLLA